MSWEAEMDDITTAVHLAECKEHYQVYVCCQQVCKADYPFCPEHGGEPWLLCELGLL